jgi:phosphate transport system protein
LVKIMVKSCLDALVRQDVNLAKKVREMDDLVDAQHAAMYKKIKVMMETHGQTVTAGVSLLTISNNFERMGDLATNIAEEVIFMKEGEVVRHQSEHPE